jgi:hypothetical protein
MFKGARYIPAWWKNSGHGNGKTTGKFPVWWEISLGGRENFFWFMEAFITPLLYQCRWEVEKDLRE